MAQYFTKEGLQKLKDELKDIKGRQMSETKKLIAEARAFGDLKENAGYHDARDKMSFLLGRVEQLEGAINEAIIKDNDGSNKAQIGSKVKILFNESEEVYTITGPTEADILKNKISYQSPLGQKLVGKNEGDAFSYEMNGRKINVKVLEVI
jgi:transcription elongation factor GreA